MTRIRYRPIGNWTDPVTSERASSPFDSTWTATLRLLAKEVAMLSDKHDPLVIVSLDVIERHVRNDGSLHADARVRSPRVVVSFESRHGPLRYACDAFSAGRGGESRSPAWQQNVRAIALSLEALRKVDRYGVAGRGEQYTGWTAIGTGTPMGRAATEWTIERACAVLGIGTKAVERSVIEAARRELAFIHHPDRGGDPAKMVEVNTAADFLLATV